MMHISHITRLKGYIILLGRIIMQMVSKYHCSKSSMNCCPTCNVHRLLSLKIG